jgi:threonine/homoserine/homoserine lactone efflux protein
MIITPGANQLLVLQTGITISLKAAIYNVIGVTSSMFIHAVISGLGISLIIIQSPTLYNGIKLLGAGYIVFLGVNSLMNAYRLHERKMAASNDVANAPEPVCESQTKSFAKGFTTNVLNIQTSFVFLSIFPQYMNQHSSVWAQSMFLTLVFILLLLLWYLVLITLISKARCYLLKPEVQKWIKAITGSLLVGFGMKMLFRH